MHVNDFIRSRETDWKRLEALVARQRGRTALQTSEIHELGSLYRAVMSDLAIARRDYPGHRVNIFLNQLLTRAHSFIYQDDTSDFGRLGRYIVETIPQAFRQTAAFTLAAFLLFIIPAIIGFRLAVANPEVAQPLGLEEHRRTLAESQTWTDIPVEERPIISTFIMSNNIRIAILAFAGGVSFGLFTVYILTYNGLIIGAVLGLAVHYGMGDALAGFIVGHGVLELSVIFMAGGAGLALGWALLNPGRHTRLNALLLAARRSVSLAVLAVPALVVAGLIEGFISPSAAPTSARALVGIGTGILLYIYLLGLGYKNNYDLKHS